MPLRACKRRSHEHRRPQARAGSAPQLSCSSDTRPVRRARRSHHLGRAHPGLTLDPWQRNVLLWASPRLLLNATRQSGKSTVAALKAARTVLEGGLAVVVSPSLRQSGFLFGKLARHLVASKASFRRETLTEVELVTGGLACQPAGRSPGYAAQPVAAPRGPGAAPGGGVMSCHDMLGPTSCAAANRLQRAPIGATRNAEVAAAETVEHERRSHLDLDFASPLRGLLWGLWAPFVAVRCRYVCHRVVAGAVLVERKLY